MIKTIGCRGKVINGILIPCSCAKTYTEEQQDSNKLCTNPDCGHYMGNHTEKTVPPDSFGMIS